MTLSVLEPYIERFLHYIKLVRNVSPHTWRAYQSDLMQLFTFWKSVEERSGGPVALKDCLDRYFVYLFERTTDKSSIARKVSTLRSFTKYLKGEHDITVAVKLVRPRLDRKLPHYLTGAEINYLLDEVTHEQLAAPFPYRDKAVIELFYATGIRCSELVAIRMLHIQFEERCILIQGKGRRERMVIFGESCEKRLKSYFAQERPPVQHSSEPLFLNYRKEPLTTRSVQRICASFQKFLEPGRTLTPHTLRHSFATLFLNEGGDLCTVQRLLGHASLMSTERYTNVSLERLTQLCQNQHPFRSLKLGDDPTSHET